MGLNRTLSIVVMAKPPIAGLVKTRLIGDGPGYLTAHQAARVHAAMAQCVLGRLEQAFGGREGVSLVLALAGVEGEAGLPVDGGIEPPSGWEVVEQGPGDLGQRLRQVWRGLDGGAVAFVGTDSPDVPEAALEAMVTGLAADDLALGPTEDGGYWSIAAGRYLPQVFTDIDWGTPRVYHQTLEAAKRAGRSVHVLPRWQDVDEPGDLARLRRRLVQTREPTLQRLAQRLASILNLTTDLSA